MEGIVVFDHADAAASRCRNGRVFERWKDEIKRSHRGRHRDVPETLLKLFNSEHVGKLVLQVARINHV